MTGSYGSPSLGFSRTLRANFHGGGCTTLLPAAGNKDYSFLASSQALTSCFLEDS